MDGGGNTYIAENFVSLIGGVVFSSACLAIRHYGINKSQSFLGPEGSPFSLLGVHMFHVSRLLFRCVWILR